MSEILKAINSVSAELAKTGIGKTRQNREQGYDYRGIDDYLNALSPLLAKHGIVIAPEYGEISSTEVAKTAKGNAVLQARVTGRFTLHSIADGSTITVAIPGEGRDSADKALNKAMSTAYKYMAAQVFCIPFVGMKDGEDDEDRDEEIPPEQSALLGMLRAAALDGPDALAQAFADVPKSAHKAAVWANYGASLKAAAKAATEQK